MQKFLIIIALLFVLNLTKAQELNCTVQVTHAQIQTTNIQIFQSMETDIREFLNNHKWTEHVFSNNERIECNIAINLSDYNGTDKFTGTIQVQSRRPVFNSSYNTVMFNYKEEDNNFNFEYIERQPLDFNENTHLSNLTSVLAFYANIIIGLDYDSFSSEGGGLYLQKAQTIVNNAQSSNDLGWKAYESRKQNNRYFLIEALLNKTYSPIRRCMYRFHRLGLDVMSERPELGRAEIAESLKLVQKVFREKPTALFLSIFFIAKSEELVKIFSEGPIEERQKVATLLKEMDVVNSSKYESITKQQ